MLAIGTALLLGAALLLAAALVAGRRWTLRSHLAELRPKAIATRAGRQVSLYGEVLPGPGGAIESRLAGAPCVWHAHEVLRHFRQVAPGRGGDGERGCDSIADYGSTDLFALAGPGRAERDPARLLLVDPEDAEFVKVDMCLQRIVGRPQRGVAAQADDLLARVKGRISGVFRGETIEFEYREWIIRSGERVVVHGQVAMREGRPVLVAPPDARLRIEVGGAAETGERPTPATALMLGAAAIASAGSGATLLLL
ncbi:hypothetical protein CLV63_103352 [Murinocardiopsis flavida]|uniref:RING-type E3 ubiquitin transferase n=1 Tax=Murinocardiopsis flavida TaxID=645275 RepID=A0A2P8DQY7_9ACTN|nr:hypothetical protein [Murinocardiopsis flavida]PSK99627.1 hypothetical protein CLV63_103352 [Murinocardiopsis flavida]